MTRGTIYYNIRKYENDIYIIIRKLTFIGIGQIVRRLQVEEKRKGATTFLVIRKLLYTVQNFQIYQP